MGICEICGIGIKNLGRHIAAKHPESYQDYLSKARPGPKISKVAQPCVSEENLKMQMTATLGYIDQQFEDHNPSKISSVKVGRQYVSRKKIKKQQASMLGIKRRSEKKAETARKFLKLFDVSHPLLPSDEPLKLPSDLKNVESEQTSTLPSSALEKKQQDCSNGKNPLIEPLKSSIMTIDLHAAEGTLNLMEFRTEFQRVQSPVALTLSLSNDLHLEVNKVEQSLLRSPVISKVDTSSNEISSNENKHPPAPKELLTHQVRSQSLLPSTRPMKGQPDIAADLNLFEVDSGYQDGAQDQRPIEKLVFDTVMGSKNIVFFTGAGISVSCGIPTFRGEDGIHKEKFFGERGTHVTGKEAFTKATLNDPQKIRSFISFHGDFFQKLKLANPSVFHQKLKQLSDLNRIVRIYDQNVDMLFDKVGISERIYTPIHKSYSRLRCLRGHSQPENINIETIYEAMLHFDEEKIGCQFSREKRMEATHDKVLRSVDCQSLLIPDLLYFDSEEPLDLSQDVVNDCNHCKVDCLIIVGTSLEIGAFVNLILAYSEHFKNIPVIVVNPSDVRKKASYKRLKNYTWLNMTSDEFASKVLSHAICPQKQLQSEVGDLPIKLSEKVSQTSPHASYSPAQHPSPTNDLDIEKQDSSDAEDSPVKYSGRVRRTNHRITSSPNQNISHANAENQDLIETECLLIEKSEMVGPTNLHPSSSPIQNFSPTNTLVAQNHEAQELPIEDSERLGPRNLRHSPIQHPSPDILGAWSNNSCWLDAILEFFYCFWCRNETLRNAPVQGILASFLAAFQHRISDVQMWNQTKNQLHTKLTPVITKYKPKYEFGDYFGIDWFDYLFEGNEGLATTLLYGGKKCPCGNARESFNIIHHLSFEMMVAMRESVRDPSDVTISASQIKKWVDKKCGHCKKKITRAHGSVMIINVETLSEYSNIKVPQIVTVDGETWNLTFALESPPGTDHFVGKILINDQWVFYDDMFRKGKTVKITGFPNFGHVALIAYEKRLIPKLVPNTLRHVLVESKPPSKRGEQLCDNQNSFLAAQFFHDQSSTDGQRMIAQFLDDDEDKQSPHNNAIIPIKNVKDSDISFYLNRSHNNSNHQTKSEMNTEFSKFVAEMYQKTTGSPISSSGTLASIFSPAEKQRISFETVDAQLLKYSFDVDSIIIVSDDFPIIRDAVAVFPFTCRKKNISRAIHVYIPDPEDGTEKEIAGFKQCCLFASGPSAIFQTYVVFPGLGHSPFSGNWKNFMSDNDLKDVYELLLLPSMRKCLKSHEFSHVPQNYESLKNLSQQKGAFVFGYFLISNRRIHLILKEMRRLANETSQLRRFADFRCLTISKGIKNTIRAETNDELLAIFQSFCSEWIHVNALENAWFDLGVEFASREDKVSIFWDKSVTLDLLQGSGCNTNGPKTYMTETCFANDLSGGRAPVTQKVRNPFVSHVQLYSTDKNTIWLPQKIQEIEPSLKSCIQRDTSYQKYVLFLLDNFKASSNTTSYNARIEYRVATYNISLACIKSCSDVRMKTFLSNMIFYKQPSDLMKKYRWLLIQIFDGIFSKAQEFECTEPKRSKFLEIIRVLMISVTRSVVLASKSSTRDFFEKGGKGNFNVSECFELFNFCYLPGEFINYSSLRLKDKNEGQTTSLLDTASSDLYKVPLKFYSKKTQLWTGLLSEFTPQNINLISDFLFKQFKEEIIQKIPEGYLLKRNVYPKDLTMNEILRTTEGVQHHSTETIDDNDSIFSKFFPELRDAESLGGSWKTCSYIQFYFQLQSLNKIKSLKPSDYSAIVHDLQENFFELELVPSPSADRIWTIKNRKLLIRGRGETHENKPLLSRSVAIIGNRNTEGGNRIFEVVSRIFCQFIKDTWALLKTWKVNMTPANVHTLESILRQNSAHELILTFSRSFICECGLSVDLRHPNAKTMRWRERFQKFFYIDIQKSPRIPGSWGSSEYLKLWRDLLQSNTEKAESVEEMMQHFFMQLECFPESQFYSRMWNVRNGIHRITLNENFFD